MMFRVRALAERLARGLIVPRSLPHDVGAARLYVSPDSQLKYLKVDLGQAERPLLDQARSLVKPGDKVWDLGANVGIFTFAAAGLSGSAGTVLAIEADPWLFSLLQRSRSAAAARDHLAPVELLCAAVAGSGCIARFSIAARGRAANALDGFGSSQTGDSRDTIMLGQVTLDDILEATFPPDLVKIDVEGAEFTVLSAAPRLLAARPMILVEVNKANSAPLAEIFQSGGYTLFDAKAALHSVRPVSECVWDTLAVPKEKVAALDLKIVA